MPMLVYGADPESFQRRWLSWVGWGLTFVSLGIAVLAWPSISLRVLVTLFSLLAFAAGLLFIVSAVAANRASLGGWWWISPLPGVLLVLLAVIALVWPKEVTELVLLAFAVIAMIWGVVDIGLAFTSRRFFPGWWMRVLRGLIVVVAGLAVAAFPVAGLLAASWMIGAWALLVGTVSIAVGLWIRATPLP
jgi:uncharacterized membrane protein HdeD (DUF308 family)